MAVMHKLGLDHTFFTEIPVCFVLNRRSRIGRLRPNCIHTAAAGRWGLTIWQPSTMCGGETWPQTRRGTPELLCLPSC